MDNITRKVALAELRKLKEREAEYRAEVDEWYRAGDGRSPRWITRPNGRRVNVGGKGYAFPYCPHGKSLWTDYDNICGGCEDGYSVYQLALWSAQEKVSEYNKRADWLLSAPDAFRRSDMYRDLIDWVVAPIQ
ncbi:hypothetical protein SEA_MEGANTHEEKILLA_258 [Streptomyces phage MeganTheeKilla]|uniref:Uncharacterized protein n=1 Tax=Streptomyces phage MeganTheeKilla TaxID=2801897 RepID=A0A7U0J5Y0_9CAUD|nr:hypothetical protein SEA_MEGANTHEEKILLA_258 [Streptomyces phage MeganTheeKilla]